MINEREELMSMADDVDALENQASDLTGPAGNFSARAMNRIINALNMALPLFNAPEVECPAEDVNGPLPPKMTSALGMLEQALSDFGEYTFSVADIVDDESLIQIADIIETAAGDKNFERWISQEGGQKEEVAVPEEMPVADEEMSDEDIENLIKTRM